MDSSEEEVEETVYEAPASYEKVEGIKPIKELGDEYRKKHPKLQFWLMKVPKGIKFNEIKTLPVSSLGDPEQFEVDGKSYSITEDLTSINDNNKDEQKYIALQSKSDDTYEVNSGLHISRFFNVCEDVTVPSIDLAKVKVAKEKVRPREGLRMRHFPTGYDIKDFKEAAEPFIPAKRAAEPIEEPERKHKKSKKEKKHKHKHKHD